MKKKSTTVGKYEFCVFMGDDGFCGLDVDCMCRMDDKDTDEQCPLNIYDSIEYHRGWSKMVKAEDDKKPKQPMFWKGSMDINTTGGKG